MLTTQKALVVSKQNRPSTKTSSLFQVHRGYYFLMRIQHFSLCYSFSLSLSLTHTHWGHWFSDRMLPVLFSMKTFHQRDVFRFSFLLFVLETIFDWLFGCSFYALNKKINVSINVWNKILIVCPLVIISLKVCLLNYF